MTITVIINSVVAIGIYIVKGIATILFRGYISANCTCTFIIIILHNLYKINVCVHT